MRHFIFIYPLFLSFTFFSPLDAKPVQSDSLQDTVCECPRKLVINTWHDGWRTAAAPLKWQRTDWLRVAALLGAGGLLCSVETDINRYWVDHSSAALSIAAKITRQFGNKFILFPAFGTIYLAGFFSDNQQICRIGSAGIRGLVVASVLTAGVKFLAQREGPDVHDLWHGPVVPFQGESFPSGHATLAFATATVLTHELKFSPAQKIAIYSLATATAWSRTYDHKHWATDVFAGAMIGYFTTKSLLNFKAPPTRSVRLEPFSSGSAVGIVFRF